MKENITGRRAAGKEQLDGWLQVTGTSFQKKKKRFLQLAIGYKNRTSLWRLRQRTSSYHHNCITLSSIKNRLSQDLYHFPKSYNGTDSKHALWGLNKSNYHTKIIIIYVHVCKAMICPICVGHNIYMIIYSYNMLMMSVFLSTRCACWSHS